VLRDIRELSDSPEAYAAELRRRWGGLAAEVASPDAALHIGPQFVILETAAFDAAAEVAKSNELRAAHRT
jgi:hypothetical protein